MRVEDYLQGFRNVQHLRIYKFDFAKPVTFTGETNENELLFNGSPRCDEIEQFLRRHVVFIDLVHGDWLNYDQHHDLYVL